MRDKVFYHSGQHGDSPVFDVFVVLNDGRAAWKEARVRLSWRDEGSRSRSGRDNQLSIRRRRRYGRAVSIPIKLYVGGGGVCGQVHAQSQVQAPKRMLS